jgi:solute carrier family 25 phosphate transporter 3
MPSDKHDCSYYFNCLKGGALACGITHTSIVSLDLVKCQRQINPTLYKSLGDGISSLWNSNGLKGVTVGWLPTFIGYSLQGMAKFGFYEMFKDVYVGIAGEKAEKFKVIGFAVSSASAEIIADILLCPFEAVKIRMQTSKLGTFPLKLVPAMNQIRKNEGINGFYKGLAPLWARQIPYTIVKFVFFEKTVEMFYKYLLTSKPKNEYCKSQQLAVTFLSGYIAGILCAIVSHPADTMVSKLNNLKTEGSLKENINKIYSEIGFNGLWRGLGTRILMIGTLTGLQWWTYDTYKSFMGLQTSGGLVKK